MDLWDLRDLVWGFGSPVRFLPKQEHLGNLDLLRELGLVKGLEIFPHFPHKCFVLT